MSNVAGKRHECPKCHLNRQYSYACDCFYCPSCDEWLEPMCEMHLCIYCLGRKPRPSGHGLCKPRK